MEGMLEGLFFEEELLLYRSQTFTDSKGATKLESPFSH